MIRWPLVFVLIVGPCSLCSVAEGCGSARDDKALVAPRPFLLVTLSSEWHNRFVLYTFCTFWDENNKKTKCDHTKKTKNRRVENKCSQHADQLQQQKETWTKKQRWMKKDKARTKTTAISCCSVHLDYLVSITCSPSFHIQHTRTTNSNLESRDDQLLCKLLLWLLLFPRTSPRPSSPLLSLEGRVGSWVILVIISFFFSPSMSCARFWRPFFFIHVLRYVP